MEWFIKRNYLTLDVNKNTGKTEKDVKNLMDIAKGLLEKKIILRNPKWKVIQGQKDFLKNKTKKAHELYQNYWWSLRRKSNPDTPEVPDKSEEKTLIKLRLA